MPLKLRRDAIIEKLKAALDPRVEIREAYLFGSTALGTAQEHSDVDVAVYLDRPSAPASPYGFVAELSADLMTVLGVSKVDVVLLNNTQPLLYHRILRDGLRILSRDLQETTTREGRALSRYCDYLPQLRKIEQSSRVRADRGEFGR